MTKLGIFIFLFHAIFISFTSSTCPPGTVESLTDKTVCYLFWSEKKEFLNAEEICVQHGGHLASVNSMFDKAFISEQGQQNFSDSATSDFWIGANRLLTPGIWGWIDGSPFSFTDWDKKGQPQNVTGNDCGAITLPAGTWLADTCYKQKSFVCLIHATTTLPPQKKCPTNWSYFDKTGFCYYVGTNKTWGESEDYCVSQNSHLASIHSLDENSFVTNLIPFDPNNHGCNTGQWAWIGLFTVTNQTNWRWIDGTNYNYSVWAPGRPGYPNALAYCAVIWNGPYCNAPLETWADGICSQVFGFYICKKLP